MDLLLSVWHSWESSAWRVSCLLPSLRFWQPAMALRGCLGTYSHSCATRGGGSWDIPCLREEVVPVRVEIEWRSNDILGYYLS